MTEARNPGTPDTEARDEEPVEMDPESSGVQAEPEPLGADSVISSGRSAPQPDGSPFRG